MMRRHGGTSSGHTAACGSRLEAMMSIVKMMSSISIRSNEAGRSTDLFDRVGLLICSGTPGQAIGGSDLSQWNLRDRRRK